MTEPQSAATAVRGQARDAMQAALVAEIESVVLDRMSDAGGVLAKVSRIRSAFGEVMGVVGQIQDIIAMAMAGYEAMTTERRMVRRTAAAHGFGYWAFQHQIRRQPLQPPANFTADNIASDAQDRSIGQRTGNSDFSSDGGLTAAEWNNIWRDAVRTTVTGLDTRLRTQIARGRVQTRLQERFGSALRFDRQSPQAIATQYRTMVICAGFGHSPSAAAGGFLVTMLKGKPRVEIEPNLRLYRRYPYGPA
ncbi:MAG: hypothetical protein QNJ15_11115 [Erythrobacter sp.]|nr:hypothetical protein [Erythrobacter sp.]